MAGVLLSLASFLPFRPIVATGGVVTDVLENGVLYRVHRFSQSGSSNFLISDSGSGTRLDLFLVGGGAGGNADRRGGGGGFTRTETGLFLASGTYPIIVGAGGPSNTNGSLSSGFGFSANGGNINGTGGSGGGAGGGGDFCSDIVPGRGGSNGSNGGQNSVGGLGSLGQGSTTAEFGEAGKTIYSGGGAGSTCGAPGLQVGDINYAPPSEFGGGGATGQNGTNGLGGGGGGADGSRGFVPGSGGSGVAVIRYPLVKL